MKRLAVFCGSNSGASEIYKESAILLGKELAKRNITLVYGGATVGIMGVLADTVLEEGGQVIGVIPTVLEAKEISHSSLTELIVVHSMHERKQKMSELADGFIVLPGGAGTLEEFFEVFTWSQIGLNKKPCGILNINHYYDLLIQFFEHMCKQQFMQEKFLKSLIIESDVTKIFDKFTNYVHPGTKYEDGSVSSIRE